MPLSQKIAERLVNAGRSVADYAVQNLPRLIVAEDGTIVWDEAFQKLRERVKDPDGVTNNDVASVLEELAPQFRYEQLDEVLTNIDDWKIKLAVAGGLATAKSLLKIEPKWQKEMRDQREKLILKMLQHQDTLESYELLKDKPKLTTFITDFVLLKLGVPPVQEKLVEQHKPLQKMQHRTHK